MQTKFILTVLGVGFTWIIAPPAYAHKDSTEELRNELSAEISNLNQKVDIELVGYKSRLESSQLLAKEALDLSSQLMEMIKKTQDEQLTQLGKMLELSAQISGNTDSINSVTRQVNRMEETSVARLQERMHLMQADALKSAQVGLTTIDRLKKLEKKLSSGVILRQIREQEALRAEVRLLRSNIEEIELSQNQFAARLRSFYADLDRVRELALTAPSHIETIDLEETENSQTNTQATTTSIKPIENTDYPNNEDSENAQLAPMDEIDNLEIENINELDVESENSDVNREIENGTTDSSRSFQTSP